MDNFDLILIILIFVGTKNCTNIIHNTIKTNI